MLAVEEAHKLRKRKRKKRREKKGITGVPSGVRGLRAAFLLHMTVSTSLTLKLLPLSTQLGIIMAEVTQAAVQ